MSMKSVRRVQEFPLLVPPVGSIRLDQIVDQFCEKDRLVRSFDGIYGAPTEGEKQGPWALSVYEYWQRVCHDLKDGRLAWAARLKPESSEWVPLSGRLASKYEIIDVDHGELSGPGGSVVYEACFMWISDEGPSIAPAPILKEGRGRKRIDWSPAVNKVIVDLIKFPPPGPKDPTGAGWLMTEIIKENRAQLAAQGIKNREGGNTALTGYMQGKFLESPKFDPVDYAQAYADLLKAVYEAAILGMRRPGTTMKKPPQ